MAVTTAHNLSSFVSQCIKPPINPKTGAVLTLHERERNNFGDKNQEIEGTIQQSALLTDSLSVSRNLQTSAMKSNDLLDILTFELGNLSDNDFYSKLNELKIEHKSTLSFYEKMHNEKVGIQDNGKDNDPNSLGVNESLEILRQSVEKPGFMQDRIRDMSTKISKKEAWTSKPQNPNQFWKITSDSEDDNAPHVADSLKDQNSTEKMRHKTFTSSRIEDMWDSFSVDDYAVDEIENNPIRNKKEALHGKLNKTASGWRHRLTIPKPFEMTLRDEDKPKKKTSAMIDLEKQLIERQRAEEAECHKKFKARPVPAHVYIPLYDEVMEKAETKRRVNKELSKEMFKTVEKPFKFMKREENKIKHKRDRIHSAPCHFTATPIKPKFKATPIPRDVNDETVMDRIREEEEYRRIRMKMRSEELLMAASLPPSMEAREKAKLMHRQMVKSTKYSKNNSKKNLMRDPPNFQVLHKRLFKEIAANRRDSKEATVCKPFMLRTSSIPSNIDKIHDDIKADERCLKETRWPYKNARMTPRRNSFSGSLSGSLDSIPAKLTASAELRKSVNQEKLHQLKRSEKEEASRKHQMKAKEKQLKKEINEKAAANYKGFPLKEIEQEKIKKFKQSERERMIEYQKELQKIQERVKNRPLLFEQQSQINARKQAEKKYSDTLRDAGLDEDFINSYEPEEYDSDENSVLDDAEL